MMFLSTMVAITISIGLCNGNLGVPCKESERQALLIFQKDLEDPSNRLSSWVGEGVCCNWTGVVCDDLTGHVRELHLNKPDSQQDLHLSYGDFYVTSTWLGVLLGPNFSTGSSIGVCYGMVANDLPPPREVIDMYKSNQIGRMRLYDPNPEALEALRNSGIEVLVGVRNEDLQQLAGSYSAAENWVATYITPYSPQVQFRYIVVGNEVFPGNSAQYVLPAMQNLQNALSSGDIKVSTSIATSVLGVSYPPSAGAFSEDTIEYMVPIAQYLNNIGAPLLANVYPYFAYIGDPIDISLPYALFASETVVVTDVGLSYDNLFDTMVDALYAALEKAGAPQVQVVVSETGWPSDGNGEVTTPENAQIYNSNLISHVLSSRGTPRRPGNSTETYVFAMFNENMKPGAAVERHWGLFYPNKSQVYPINFPVKRLKHKTWFQKLMQWIIQSAQSAFGKRISGHN